MTRSLPTFFHTLFIGSKDNQEKSTSLNRQSTMAWGSIKRSFSSLISEESFEKQIVKIANGLHPSDTAFPWERLIACAENFIRKQKNIDVHSGIDEFLVDLIEKCSLKDVALAACADLLSIHTIEGLLDKFRPALGSIPGLQFYIQILVAINHHKTQIVNDDEAKRARMVLSLPLHNPVTLLRPLVSLIRRGVPRNSHLVDHLDALARQSCSILSTRMETFKASADWLTAYEAALWIHDDLKDFSDHPNVRPNDVSLIDILYETFPTWSSWAAWEPNIRTLQLFALHLKTRSRDKILIKDLLALDGPDFTIGNTIRRTHYPTMRERLSAVNRTKLVQQCGAIKFDLIGSKPDHVRATLDVLNKLILDVCAKDTIVHNDCRMLLLQQICLSDPINEERLSLLEAAFDTRSTEIISAIREVKLAEKESREPDAEELSILFKVLDWDASKELRKSLGESVVASMCKHLEKTQGMLKMIVNVDRYWTMSDLQLLEALQSFGEVCGKAPKLKRQFPGEMRAVLERWPAKWEVSLVLFHISPAYHLYG